MPVGMPEFADNRDPRCPVILLLDTSGSMDGTPISALNQGIKLFKDEVEDDDTASLRVEVAIITFGGSVRLVQDFVTIDKFYPTQLSANGGTPMGQAIESALDLLEKRKATYKNNGIQYYRPWIFMITDGAPTDSWFDTAQKVINAEKNKSLVFFAVGVGGADFNTLEQITSDYPPVKLDGLKFKKMFKWLSNSMKKVSSSRIGGQTSLDPINAWATVPT